MRLGGNPSGRGRGPSTAVILAVSFALALSSNAVAVVVCPMVGPAAIGHADGDSAAAPGGSAMAHCHDGPASDQALVGADCCAGRTTARSAMAAAPAERKAALDGAYDDAPFGTQVTRAIGGDVSSSLRATPRSEVRDSGPPSLSSRTDVLRC
jgi:hypothetical protein